MLYSERTFKKREDKTGQFPKLYLYQQLFAFKKFYVKAGLSNIFKTTRAMNLTKAILESA